MKSPSLDYFQILRILNDHGVAFILVGRVCGVLHGAPVTTYDLDIVRLNDADNAVRIMGALEELDAFSRLHQKRVRPDKSHLTTPGHLLLQTRFGHLDLLGEIGAGHDFEALLRHTVMVSIRGISFRMLDLETLIRTKEETGRVKDRVTLPILRATLAEKQKGNGSPSREPRGC